MKKWFFFLPLALFLTIAVIFGGRLLYYRALGHPSVLKDKPAPTTIFESFNGGTKLEVNDLIGQVTLVNLFASWCPPCREEHPHLMTLSKSVKIIGVNYKDKEDNALNFLKEGGNPYSKIVADTKGRNAIEWGVYGIPETFILDKNGIIRYKFIGPITPEKLARVIMPEIKKLQE